MYLQVREQISGREVISPCISLYLPMYLQVREQISGREVISPCISMISRLYLPMYLQVREQISGREAAMRTQLGLLKNATAFALYVDDAASNPSPHP